MINIATEWQITNPQGDDRILDLVKCGYMRNDYTGTFRDFEDKVLDVKRGTKKEWLEYFSRCKKVIRTSILNKVEGV